MLIRIWNTGVDPKRLSEYEEFEQQQSLPMFRAQKGCLGIWFLRKEGSFYAMSLWKDRTSIEALAESETYAQTVNALKATGLLQGEQTVQVFEVRSGKLFDLSAF